MACSRLSSSIEAELKLPYLSQQFHSPVSSEVQRKMGTRSVSPLFGALPWSGAKTSFGRLVWDPVQHLAG